MKRLAMLFATLSLVGCAGTGGPKGLHLQRISPSAEPMAIEEAGPKEKIQKRAIPTRVEILRRISRNRTDAEALNRVVDEKGGVHSAAFWTGAQNLAGLDAYKDWGVDWAEGIAVTPVKWSFKTEQVGTIMLLRLNTVTVGSGVYASSIVNEDVVTLNFISHYLDRAKPPPDKLLLFSGVFRTPLVLGGNTATYLLSMGIEPKHTAKVSQLEVVVGGETLSFSSSEEGIVSLLELGGGKWGFKVYTTKQHSSFRFRYVKLTRL